MFLKYAETLVIGNIAQSIPSLSLAPADVRVTGANTQCCRTESYQCYPFTVLFCNIAHNLTMVRGPVAGWVAVQPTSAAAAATATTDPVCWLGHLHRRTLVALATPGSCILVKSATCSCRKLSPARSRERHCFQYISTEWKLPRLDWFTVTFEMMISLPATDFAIQAFGVGHHGATLATRDEVGLGTFRSRYHPFRMGAPDRLSAAPVGIGLVEQRQEDEP